MKLITNLKTLTDNLNLAQEKYHSEKIQKITRDFPLRVTHEFAARINNNCFDPLLLQILPNEKELNKTRGFSSDPLGEEKALATPCILHKYYGRVLLLVTKNCAMHCRFCFRRNFLKNRCDYTEKELKNAYRYIERDKTISEVILSGGDPLFVSDKKIQSIIRALSPIKHIKRLRIHTRLPIAAPSRITKKLVQILTSTRLKPIIVIHCNHASEINSDVAAAIDLMRSAKLNVLNQSTLLKNINDSSDAQVKLSERLFEIGVIPYYLHLLDKVSGAAHFEVNLNKAKKIHNEMQKKLPGYLVPRLVREEKGKPAKTEL